MSDPIDELLAEAETATENGDEVPEKTMLEEISEITTNDPDQLGNALGGMMSKMFKRTNGILNANPDETPEESVNKLMIAMYGPEQAAVIKHHQTVTEYFEKTLREKTMKEAIRETKEKFELPDDYIIEMKMRIQFSLGDQKNSVPEID